MKRGTWPFDDLMSQSPAVALTCQKLLEWKIISTEGNISNKNTANKAALLMYKNRRGDIEGNIMAGWESMLTKVK